MPSRHLNLGSVIVAAVTAVVLTSQPAAAAAAVEPDTIAFRHCPPYVPPVIPIRPPQTPEWGSAPPPTILPVLPPLPPVPLAVRTGDDGSTCTDPPVGFEPKRALMTVNFAPEWDGPPVLINDPIMPPLRVAQRPVMLASALDQLRDTASGTRHTGSAFDGSSNSQFRGTTDTFLN